MNAKLVLAVDFDDTVVDFNQSFLKYHNQTYGTTVSYVDITQGDMCPVYGVDSDTLYTRILEWYHSDHHDETEIVKGASEILPLLAEFSSLHIVTSRALRLRDRTRNRIDKLFPGVFTGVHCTNSYSRDGLLAVTKLDICRQLGASILIDDTIHHAEEAIANGIAVIMPNRPWNASYKNQDVHRADDWHDVWAHVAKYI